MKNVLVDFIDNVLSRNQMRLVHGGLLNEVALSCSDDCDGNGAGIKCTKGTKCSVVSGCCEAYDNDNVLVEKNCCPLIG
jgi:hypothetical protein